MSDHGTDAEADIDAGDDTDTDGGSDGPPELDGMRVQRALGELMEHDPSLQGEQIYGALQVVARPTEGEGPQARISWEAAEENLDEIAEVVSAPETRGERAETELEQALAAAGEDRTREVVQHRLDGFAARLDGIQGEVGQVGGQLQELRAENEDLFSVAQRLISLEHRANDLRERAGDLQLDLEEFQTWVSDPSTRFDELDGDLNALADSLEGLEAGTDRVERAHKGETDAVDAADPGLAWADTTFSQRVLDLLCADLRWEFDALREWSEAEDHDVDARIEELDGRIESLTERVETVGERLGRLGRDGWDERFEDERAAFEAEVEDVSPPVDWGWIQGLLQEHRQGLVANKQ